MFYTTKVGQKWCYFKISVWLTNPDKNFKTSEYEVVYPDNTRKL